MVMPTSSVCRTGRCSVWTVVERHLRHPRLRHRPAGHRRELESPSGGWRKRQPASVRRANCRCPARSGCGHRQGDPAVHRRRPARPRAAVRGSACHGGADRHRRIEPLARWVRQPHPRPTVTTRLGCSFTNRQATYDLRRLKRKGLIVRLPGHHRYQLTPLGRRFAVLFTKVRACPRTRPGRARPEATEDLAERSELAQAWRQLDRRLKPIHQSRTHRSLNVLVCP